MTNVVACISGLEEKRVARKKCERPRFTRSDPELSSPVLEFWSKSHRVSEPELSMELTVLHVSDFYPLLLMFSRLSSRLHLQLGDRCFNSGLSALTGPFLTGPFSLETVGNSTLIF